MSIDEWYEHCQNEMLEIGKIDLKEILKEDADLDDIIFYIEMKSDFTLPKYLTKEQVMEYIIQTYHVDFYELRKYFIK